MTPETETPVIPIGFSQASGLRRWHAKGRPWLSHDVTATGFTAGMRGTRWSDAIHHPTGITVKVVGGVATSIALIEILFDVVTQRADAQLARDRARMN